MGIQLATLERLKEQAFAEDILAFAADKYNAATTKGWKVMVHHVSDPTRWIDLYDAARYTGQDAVTWLNCDAWSMAWDEPVAGGWVHATNLARRKQLARRMELENFDPGMTAKAINYDLLILVNDSYASYLASRFQLEGYLLYLLTHECLHFVEDWSGKYLVVDDVPPWQDQQVVTTLSAYVENVGGWDIFKQLYGLTSEAASSPST
jgi:hypothetical protein